ncbi:aminopeptidase [Fructilactobacillus lindneri]|uniref:Aminopeptidase n=2 Tax=Fructilactobacillus lindneri TaxID=53444 RepID=A0A0R2JQD5_9LACO|nr:C1 family peptidase [Fructilactobacillus lindneri]ANZ57309.1 aminopeptidase [Fructilactobacillus lindneri]ANZ58574.1 aminopeptidase [Fructilactobacillus lindneri]KRN79344.1 aminopeptidase [Fructilactobacillus lindneri DSM 20690 = JCM 11027]POG98385.1 aminopeptidase [Fructilactobacillus lindneri]POH03784.1 aminopeptidase [Fructilactobacillus lindneri]
MDQPIEPKNIERYANNLNDYDDSNVVRRAVTHNGILKTAADFEANPKMDPVFSIDVSDQRVSDQKRSGRCWLFAALNTMRTKVENDFNVPKDFELSQAYIFFWDKFEKSNYFLNNVINTAEQPLDSRKVSFLMATPQQDGGQWDMLCALIEKYGIVPKSAMPETANSENSSELNAALNTQLRHDAVILRKMINDGQKAEIINAKRDDMINEIYRMLVYSLGKPVEKFNFEYRDQEKEYHIDENITPKAFFQKYINLDLEDYVSLINSPTEDKPYNKTYTVEMLGNVVGGRPIKHFNLPIEELKKLTIKQLEAGETVWFGSDVVKDTDRKQGIMDTRLYHVDELMHTDMSLTKAQRLDYGESVMDHAMVITGVDIVNGKPTKWKVENSWGDKVGTKGYFVMSDDWFNEFVYQVVINKKFLSEKEKEEQQQAPKILAPWDPMGTLA